MLGMHFDEMAAEYAEARPPYPDVIFETLQREGVIGRGLRVLEVGAGLATIELLIRGSEVVALEPRPQLASLLGGTAPGAQVITTRLEDVQLAEAEFDSVVAATAMHWVDLSVGLPKMHRALRPHGWLAVWRNVFGDDTVETEFRRRVLEIVAKRDEPDVGRRREQRPTMQELAAGGWFEPVRTGHWRWSVDLGAKQIGRLFRTFSNWTSAEAAVAQQAAEELGGHVTEHYQSVLHLLRRTQPASS